MPNDVTLSVGLDSSALNKSLKNVRSSLLKVAASFATAFAGKKIIEAASRQEDAINSLNNALLRSGEFSQEASKDLQDFASALQDVTTVGDEAILEQLAFAKSLGRTNEEAKSLVEAAVELTAVTDMSLDSAVKNLSKTYAGLTGELGEALPFLRELTKAELEAGKATELVLEQFGGAATGELNTFSGALQQTINTIGDFAEELGFLITQSPIVISGIKAVGDSFKAAINFLSDNSGAIREGLGAAITFLIDGIGFLVQNVMPPLIEIFLVGLRVTNELQAAMYDLLEAFTGFDFVKDTINTVTRAVLALADTIVGTLFGAFKKIADFAGVEIPAIESAVDGVRQKIEELAGADAGNALSDFVSQAADAREAAFSLVEQTLKEIENGAQKIDFDKLGRDISKALEGKISLDPKVNTESAERSFSEVALSFGKDIVATIEQNIGNAAKAFGQGALGAVVKGTQDTATAQETIQKLEVDLQNAQSIEERRDIEKQITEAQAAQVEAQKTAAETLTTELGGFIADVFLPGAGQFVKLFLELAKDPEAFKAFIEGFVESLPEIIDAIAEAIPIVIEVLAENLDKILIAITVGAFKIVGKAIEGLGRGIAIILSNIGRELINAVAAVGEVFANEIVAGAGQFINKLIDEITGAFSDLGGGGTLGKLTSGDIGGFFGDIGGALGFADGGIIPQGFPNDTGVARVTSGEMVLNQDQQQNLFNLLNGGGGQRSAPPSQMLTVNLVMNEEVLARQILELNRDNQRIA